jgi:predicted ribosomally synthesized peptide with SipW-like signal peptide
MMYEESGSRRRIASSLIVLAVAASALVIAATGAIFNETESVGGNTFTTGTVDISTSPTSALLTTTAMAPGDRVENPLTVTNDGSLQLRYAIQRSATDDGKDLRGSLGLRIAVRGGGACDFPYHNTDGTETTLSDDTEIYGTATGLPGTATNTVGDAAQGGQSGDRTLDGAASEVLCFAVVLPLSAGNGLQDATTTATFDFVAEQTANN